MCVFWLYDGGRRRENSVATELENVNAATQIAMSAHLLSVSDIILCAVFIPR